MPVFNCEQYVAEAIDSILSQKTDHAVKIIVVDDGSTDRSGERIKSFGDSVRYLYQENAGIGAARNTGIRLSQSGFLAFLDADDLWTPNKIQLQMEQLLERPCLEAVFGHALQFPSPELDAEQQARLKVDHEPHAHELSPTMLIRRKSFDRIGPYSETYLGCDVDWRLRARELGLSYQTLSEVVFHRRVHPASFTYQNRHNLDYTQILKRSLDRRRGQRSSEN
jgi:glycosyltransferase involved in cell wall biosynthesis